VQRLSGWVTDDPTAGTQCIAALLEYHPGVNAPQSILSQLDVGQPGAGLGQARKIDGARFEGKHLAGVARTSRKKTRVVADIGTDIPNAVSGQNAIRKALIVTGLIAAPIKTIFNQPINPY
jgi:hypothetical protein